MTQLADVGTGPDVAALRDAAAARLENDLALIGTLVGIDSGRDQPSGVEQVQRIVANRLVGLGASANWETGAVPHVLLRLPGGARRVAVVTHADTVFPAGTAAHRPFRRDGDIAWGPGVVDMKGGLGLAVCALELLAATRQRGPAVDMLIVGDEEIRTTAPPFMDTLRGADAALVLECGRPGGGFVTARKAGLWARVIATGRAAHSGTSKDAGHNAIDALAAEVVRIAGLHGSRGDLSVSTGTIAGGSSVNSVPERAEAWFDVRAQDPRDLRGAVGAMAAFADHAGITLTLVETEQWPAMTPTPAAQQLAARYAALARRLGVAVRQVATGGMSDGSWLSAAGIPTIDGLGPVGDADHSDEEWMQVSSFPVRAALLAGLLVALEREGAPTADA